MTREFRKIVEGVFEDESAKQLNLASEACREDLAEKIEERIKAKFHIFRINRILTGDSGAPKKKK
jgi:hypothetical protein